MKLRDRLYELKKPHIQPPVYFFHIPKTAGTTFGKHAASQYAKSRRFKYQTWNALLPTLSRNQRGKKSPILSKRTHFIQGHYGRTIEDYLPSKFQLITILREPVDRTVSHISHIQFDPEGNNWVKKGFIKPDEALDDVVADAERMQFFANYQTRYLSVDLDVLSKTKSLQGAKLKNWHLDSDKEFILPDLSERQMLSAAKRKLESMTFFGLQEFFQETLLLSAYHFEWSIKFNEERSLSYGYRPSVEELNKKTRRRLEDINGLDRRLYKHAREVFLNDYVKFLNKQLGKRMTVKEFLSKRAVYNRQLIEQASKKGWKRS